MKMDVHIYTDVLCELVHTLEEENGSISSIFLISLFVVIYLGTTHIRLLDSSDL